MTESKKKLVFEKISDVLSKYEVTGISKNELIRILQQEGIASRMTFYEYFDEMADPKRGNIISVVVPKGKINPLCFPTPSNQALVKLKVKFKSINDLLNLIKKYPSIGDCFVPLPKLKKILDGEKIPPYTGFGYHTSLYSEIIHSKNSSFGKSTSYITFRSHGARQDILKNISIFLTNYLHSPHRKYSKQIQKECIKILTPTFLHALKIFNTDYVETINVSKQLRETIQLTAPKDAGVLIVLIKAPIMPQIEVEFLKILGRYYYTISKQFSKNMEIDSCKEQQIISKVIKNFYCEHDLKNKDDEQLDLQDIENIIKLNYNLTVYREKENDLKNMYGFDEHSIAIKLAKTFSKDEENIDDALHIKIYYLKLFLSLDIFSKKEQQLIEHVIKHDEKILNSKEWIDPKENRKLLEDLFPNELSNYD